MGQLVLSVGTEDEFAGVVGVAMPPGHPRLFPEIHPLGLGAGLAEEFHLHLLKFAGAEDEMFDGHLVAERLAHLGDAERRLEAHAVHDVLELHEHRLGGFRAQVDHGAGGNLFSHGPQHLSPIARGDGLTEHRIRSRRLAEMRGNGGRQIGLGGQLGGDLGHVLHRVHGTQGGAEHQIELLFSSQERAADEGADIAAPRPGLGRRGFTLGHEPELGGRQGDQAGQDIAVPLQGDAEILFNDLGVGLGHALVGAGDGQGAGRSGPGGLVGAETLLGHLAVHQGVGKTGGVARCAPNFGAHDDAGVDADDVLAGGDHVPPPLAHQIALQFGAQGTVVIGRFQPAVNLGRLKDEAAIFAQGDQLLHHIVGGGGSGRGHTGLHGKGPAAWDCDPTGKGDGRRVVSSGIFPGWTG